MILPPEAIIIGYDDDTWEPLWEFPKGDAHERDAEKLDEQTGMDILQNVRETGRILGDSPLGIRG